MRWSSAVLVVILAGAIAQARGAWEPKSFSGDLPADPNARLQDGALEGSNVSAVETMIAMIAAARQFEQQLKMVHSAQEKEQAAAKLLSNS